MFVHPRRRRHLSSEFAMCILPRWTGCQSFFEETAETEESDAPELGGNAREIGQPTQLTTSWNHPDRIGYRSQALLKDGIVLVIIMRYVHSRNLYKVLCSAGASEWEDLVSVNHPATDSDSSRLESLAKHFLHSQSRGLYDTVH